MPYIRHTQLPTVRKHVLTTSIVTNLKSFLGVHVAMDSNIYIHFDSDAVEIILDSGCSFTISFYKEDFTAFKASKGQVEGLGLHKIKVKDTLKYTVIDNNGDNIKKI